MGVLFAITMNRVLVVLHELIPQKESSVQPPATYTGRPTQRPDPDPRLEILNLSASLSGSALRKYMSGDQSYLLSPTHAKWLGTDQEFEGARRTVNEGRRPQSAGAATMGSRDRRRYTSASAVHEQRQHEATDFVRSSSRGMRGSSGGSRYYMSGDLLLHGRR